MSDEQQPETPTFSASMDHVVGACDSCGALSVVPEWNPRTLQAWVRSCSPVPMMGTGCNGTVRVVGILTLGLPRA